jgi:Na+/melibiose symporter-like transporter
MYDIIEVAYLMVGNVCCNKLLKRIGKNYVYIAIAVINCCCQCVNFAVLRRQRGNEADLKVHFA